MKMFVAEIIKKFMLLFCLLASQLVCAEDKALTSFLMAYQYSPVSLIKLSSGHDAVKVSFEDKEGVFIVDTGAISIINTSTLRKYDLNKTDRLKSIEAAGAAGDIQIDFYPGKKLRLNDHVEWSPEKIGGTDISDVARSILSSTGVRIDGLIGMDLLVEFNALIDIPERTLYLQRLDGEEGTRGFSRALAHYFVQDGLQPAKLRSVYLKPIEAPYLAVDITINQVKGILVVDSGAGQSLLNSESLALFGVTKRRRALRQEHYGAGGRFRVRRYSLDSYLVAGKETGLSAISTADLSATANFIKLHSGVDINGVLGQDYLVQKKAVIDIGNNRMFIKSDGL